MSVIAVDHLTKDYGHKRGVFDISLHVEKGICYGFLGPNGAGKTTTIRHLMGFSKPQCGKTSILGYDSWKYAAILKNEVGYLPGEIAFPKGYTGTGFLKQQMNMRNVKDTSRVESLLKRFELDPGMHVERMSLGVRRKLAVVTAFLHDPEILILDEPTSGLDPVMQENFIEFIHTEKARGKTILLSSHIFSEIDSTCDRIAIIKDGRIVSEFVADDLKHASRKYYTVEFENRPAMERFKAESAGLDSCVLHGEGDRSVDLSIEDDDLNELIALLSALAVRSFSNRKETLEDYFMKFYREEKDFGGALR